MASVPSTMRALAVRKYGKPSTYEIVEMPVPEMKSAEDVLVKVHAGSISTGDTQIANGSFKLLSSSPGFPLKIGVQGAGVVVAVGTKVTHVKVGDEVYGLHFERPVLPFTDVAGWNSEYVVTRGYFLLIKPPHLTFSEAAGLPGSAITGYQCFRRALALRNEPDGTLEGKTVFVPGALSSTGMIGVQLAKHFGASKVISTVSTEKMKLVEQHLPGVVDQLLDYKTQNIVHEVGKGKVDIVYNTQWTLTSTFPLVEPKAGAVVSIASVPPAALMRQVLGPSIPFWAGWILDGVNAYYRWLLRGTNVKLDFVSGNPSVREDMESIGEIIARQKIRPVVTEVDFNDLAAVRREATKVSIGKGGLGSMVIKIA